MANKKILTLLPSKEALEARANAIRAKRGRKTADQSNGEPVLRWTAKSAAYADARIGNWRRDLRLSKSDPELHADVRQSKGLMHLRKLFDPNGEVSNGMSHHGEITWFVDGEFSSPKPKSHPKWQRRK